jgi:uncharacterized lipoprotein YajG
MYHPTLSSFRLGFALIGLSLLAGCTGGGMTSLSGKLVLPKDMKPSQNETVSIGFTPTDESATSAAAVYDRTDRSFVVKNIKPGKYTITVSILPYMGEKDTAKRKVAYDKLNKAYDPKSSKLTYDVTTEPNQSITVDVDKGTVTKS